MTDRPTKSIEARHLRSGMIVVGIVKDLEIQRVHVDYVAKQVTLYIEGTDETNVLDLDMSVDVRMDGYEF